MRKFLLKDLIFCINFSFRNNLEYSNIIKLLLIFRRYYGDFKTRFEIVYINGSKDYGEYVDWDDLILKEFQFFPNKELILELDDWHVTTTNKAWFYVNNFKLNNIEKKLLDEVNIYWGKSNIKDDFFCIITFYTNVFTNKNFDEEWNIEKQKWDIKVLDESEAARKNRKTLHDFIHDLEDKLDIKDIEVESEVLDEKYIYKYGITEDAVIRGYEDDV